MKKIFVPHKCWASRVTLFLLAVAMLLSANSAFALDGNTLPTGGTVTSGSGTISASGSRMTIDQSTPRMIANWDSFNIGVDAGVTFNQPSQSAVALNRIYDQSASQIMGSLNANGQVFLVNPSGIIFGASSQVNVGGLAASTLDIADKDFNSGNYTFSSDGITGSIANAGTINVDGGYVAFISPVIENSGSITADGGTVAMAAGEKVRLDLSGDGLITYVVDEGAVDAQIKNSGLIHAHGGAVYLTAKAKDALTDAVVNNSGIIEATGIHADGGRIMLLADGGETTISGTLDASSEKGTGGGIVVTGDAVIIESGAHLNASGATGGGEVLVGGSWQGCDDSIYEATTTIVETGALLEANAIVNGDGGTVVAWSDVNSEDSVTLAHGTFQANGGIQGGDGGRIETSGHYLDVEGVSGSAAAINGESGNWLFDPWDITISSTGTNITGDFTATAASTITSSSINALLNGGTSVTINTGTTGTQNGNITVNSAIAKSSGAEVTLTLEAETNIAVNAAISSTSGVLNVELKADTDADGNGIIILDSDIATNGGYLNFGTGTTATINTVETLVGGDVYVLGSDNTATVIDTSGGAVNVYGEMIVANTHGLEIATGGGNVAFHGIINSGNSYESVYRSSAINWVTARAAASNDVNGDGDEADIGDSYLATITSRLENAIASLTVNYKASWLGGQRRTDIGTNTIWRWVTGPEGQEDGGNGLPFFEGISGGTAIDGAYTNWNTGEPNNSGNETALQFVGSYGQWNDLNQTTKTLNYYVKETNLAGSPITVDAGGGRVTFSGEVGGFKALGSLGVTANTIAINSGGVTTEGAQAYTGAVTLGVTDVSLVSAGGGIAFSSTVNSAVSGSESNLTMDAGTGTVSFNNAVGSALALESLDITAGDIAFSNASLTINDTLTLATSADLDQDGAWRVGGATTIDTGSGSIALIDSDNDFTGTVTVTSADAVTLVDGNALTLGAVNATGTIDIATLTSNLTLTDALSTSDSSGDAIVLNAGKSTDVGTPSGGNIIISGGTVSTGTNGRTTLYSGSISGSTGLVDFVGSGSGRFRYNSDESQTNYITALGSGIHAIYREQPIITFSVDNQQMIYGGAIPDLSYAFAGLLNGDDATTTTTASVSVGGALSSSNNYTAGSHVLSIGTITSTADDLGYSVDISDAGTLSIAQKNIIVDYTVADKIYDGTAGASVSGSTDDIVSGDSVEITETALFGDKNVGTDKAVTVSDILLAGTDAANYHLITESVSTTATITPATLTITARDAFKSHDERPYSGGNGVIYSGFVAGEHAGHLDGGLGYVGTSQGAVDVGTYTITPTGLSSTNYAIDFVGGRLIIAFTPADSGQIVGDQDDETPDGRPVSAGTIQLPTIEENETSIDGGETSLIRFADFASACEGSVILASDSSLLVTDFSQGEDTTTLSCNCAAKEDLHDVVDDLPVYMGQMNDRLDLLGVYRVKENRAAISLTRVARNVSDVGEFRERQAIGQGVTFNVSTTDGIHLELTAGMTKDGVLVISGSDDDIGGMDMERIVLMGLQSVKHNLGLSLKSIKAVHIIAGKDARQTV